MFGKLVGLTLMILLLASGLLTLRQQRLEIAHDNARLFSQIIAARQSLWDLQARGATMLQPERLAMRLEKAQVAVEPIEPPIYRSPEHGLARGESPAWQRVTRPTDLP